MRLWYGVFVKLDQLTYFLETARKSHVGRAAKALGISPSAISHSISALEDELGRELFQREGKGIRLTPHGKLLMERAQRLLEDVQSLQSDIAADNVQLRGTFRLAASHLLCEVNLSPAWTALQNEHPQLTGELFTLRSSQVVSGVANGEFDFGVCFSPQPHPALLGATLHQGNLVVAVSKDHSLLKKPLAKRFTEISDSPAVFPKAFAGIDVCEQHPVLTQFNLQPKIDFFFDSYQVAVEKVARSEAWGFFPDWVIHHYKDRIKTLGVPAGWSAPYTISGIWRRQYALNDVIKRLLHYLEEPFISKGKSGNRISLGALGGQGNPSEAATGFVRRAT